MGLIIDKFLAENPYFILSFLISIYIVGCYVVTESSIYLVIEGVKKKEIKDTAFNMCQIFLQLFCIFIVAKILDMNFYIEMFIGITVHSLIFTALTVIAFLALPKEIKESVLKEDS